MMLCGQVVDGWVDERRVTLLYRCVVVLELVPFHGELYVYRVRLQRLDHLPVLCCCAGWIPPCNETFHPLAVF